MTSQLTIGAVSKLTNLSAKTIRFYEEEGYIPPARRGESGYRLYSQTDVRRLRLIRLVRLLGLPLAEIKPLVDKAFAADCAAFASELVEVLDRQKAAIVRRIGELEVLREELDEIKSHVEHCDCEPGQLVAECDYCSILDGEGGDNREDDR